MGELTAIATGYCDRPFSRSGSLELDLEAGDYVVYVKLDQSRTLNPSSDYSDWNIPFRSYPDIVNVSALVAHFDPSSDIS